jgi:hypothetical protein
VPGGGGAFASAGRLLDAWGELGPPHQVPSGWEPGHVNADLRDQQLRGGLADPGDLVQPVDHLGERAEQRLDPGVEHGDVGAQLINPVQHPGQQEGVMVGEEPSERLRQQRPLGAHPSTGQLRQPLRVAFPGQQRLKHRPPRHPEDVAGDHRQFDLGVLQQLLDPLLFRGPGRDQVGAVAGHVPQLADWSWRTNEGRSICRSATLHSHTASSVSVLGRPGRCLTSRALTSQVSNSCASSR